MASKARKHHGGQNALHPEIIVNEGGVYVPLCSGSAPHVTLTLSLTRCVGTHSKWDIRALNSVRVENSAA